MIRFQTDKFKIEYVKIKTLSMSYGGCAAILNEEETARTGKEVFKRVRVPLHVVQSVKKLYNTTKFVKPVEAVIVSYDNLIVAIEFHAQGEKGQRTTEGLFGERNWLSYCERNLKTLKEKIESGRFLTWNSNSYDVDYYVDGQYIFALPKNESEIMNKITYLSQDKSYGYIEVTAFKMSLIANAMFVITGPTYRTCLVYQTKSGKVAISPPVWGCASTINMFKASKTDEDIYDNDGKEIIKTKDAVYSFDNVDDYYSVNVCFALAAAKTLGSVFGYEVIYPLQIPNLMLKLNTVNLPKIHKSIKNTCDCGMKFTHVLPWLMGFAHRAKNIHELNEVRGLIKYLMGKGVFYKRDLNIERIFKNESSFNNIPLLSKDKAKENAELLMKSPKFFELIAASAKNKIVNRKQELAND